MFRVEPRPRFFERRLVRYGFPSLFATAAILGLLVLWDIARKQASSQDVYLLGTILVLLALTACAHILVYQAYAQTRARLTYVKLYASDILQSLSIGVVTSDPAGIVTNINERARALVGVASDGVHKPYREVLGHAPVLVESLDRLVVRGEAFSGVDVDLTLGERKLTLRLDGRFLLSDSGERIGMILQIQDVSHLKHLDQEMRRTEQLAGLGTLAAGIAHEIKNPLAALSINAQLLEEIIDASPGAPKAEKHLEVIRSEIHRLQGIVDKYVSFARPRSIERSPASLETILNGIIALIEPESRKRKIAIIRDGYSPLPVRYLLDEGQIQQAILNLVINAIQAMEKGGSLTLRLGTREGFVTVEVGDTGPGIPTEVRERMFDLFFTTRQGGTGLGLYLTQRIVAEHRGYIDVKTGPAGTLFTLAIPAETAP